MDWSNPFWARMPEPIFELRRFEMPVVEVAEAILSPGLHGKEIRIYALCGFAAAPGNIKIIPATYMIEQAIHAGRFNPVRKLVEPTSGNMGVSLAYAGKTHGVEVVAIVSDSLPEGKRLPLLRQGAEVLTESEVRAMFRLTGSPNSIELAAHYAKEKGVVFLNQYQNLWNRESYQEWVAPTIWDWLGSKLSLSCFPLGSGGTTSGFGSYFKGKDPAHTVIATMPYWSQDIPGMRDRRRLLEVKQPWESVVDHAEETAVEVAEAMSEKLFALAGIPAGPSSGVCIGMIDHYLLGHLARGTLDNLRTADGTIGVFTTFADTFSPYVKA